MTALNVYRTATRIADEILSEQYATTLRASSVPREYADAAIAELEAEFHIAEVWRVRAEQAEAELAALKWKLDYLVAEFSDVGKVPVSGIREDLEEAWTAREGTP